LVLAASLRAGEQTIDDFISRMQKHLEARDFPSYLNSFAPEVRLLEDGKIRDNFESQRMDQVELFKVNQTEEQNGESAVFLRAYFQNSHAAIIETWKLSLQRSEGQWQVRKKDVTSSLRNLYKIRLPSTAAQRADSAVIKHKDIELAFEDPVLFFDNIPDIETALLIIGRGRLRFSPSDPKERHQLELIYKSRTLEDKISYAYLRFSPSFFKNHIEIVRDPAKKREPISQSEANLAYSLYTRLFVRSFTIENSLSGDFLSFVPQSEEAVFEFKGDKIGELTYIYSPFALDEINLYDNAKERIINLYSPDAGEGLKRFVVTFGQKFDVRDYEIELDFNPGTSFLSAKARVDVSAELSALDSLKLNLSPEFSILRINDEKQRELMFTQDKLRKLVYIYFLEPVPKGKLTSLEIYYRGKIEPPAALADVLAGPQIEKTTVLLPPQFESTLFSQSAYWYPSPPDDDDYFTARLRIIVPPNFTCIANGKLAKRGLIEKVDGVLELDKVGSSYFIFEAGQPVKYLSFIVGKISPVREVSDPFPVQVLQTTGVRMLRKNFLEDCIDILRFYESLFGPFPYEKLDIISRLWKTTGGHSPAAFIVLNELPRIGNNHALVPTEGPVNLSRWKEYFPAHEIAHQWWGQGVTWATYRDQWLSEGLAQFSSILYLKQRHGPEVYDSILKKFSRWAEKKSDRGPIVLGSRLSFYDFDAYQAIIYNKTSLILNMLLNWLGEKPFFEGLKNFYTAKKYSGARTNDFLKAMERSSGKNLEAFFKNWFESHELPEVRIVSSLTKEGDGSMLRLTVNQLTEPFVFPLTIEWEEKGQKVRKIILIERKIQEFEFRLEGTARKLSFNADGSVPGKFI
jgi:hypothetical protein